MTEYPLDIATALSTADDARLLANGGGAYWNFQSAFGGWALALGYAAIEQAHPQTALLASVTANFFKPLPDSELTATVRRLREGRRTSFLRTELAPADAPEGPVFAADYVFSDMKEKALDYAAGFPDVLDPDEAPRLPDTPGPKFLSRYDQRVAMGKPFSKQDHPNSAFWVRDAADRPWDAKALLALSDTPMPRTFFLDSMPRFGATLSYDLHVMCSRETLAAQSNDYLLVEATSDRVFSGRFSQRTRIWSRDRQLLAVSNQLAFY